MANYKVFPSGFNWHSWVNMFHTLPWLFGNPYPSLSPTDVTNQLIWLYFQSREEANGLKKAYECMLDVADYVNEVKRDKETLQIIEELQVCSCLVVGELEPYSWKA